MKIKSMPELERPVEKCLANGIESLSNDELLALLINTGTKEKSAKDLAAEVLAKDRAGLMYLRESSVDELMTVNGHRGSQGSQDNGSCRARKASFGTACPKRHDDRKR